MTADPAPVARPAVASDDVAGILVAAFGPQEGPRVAALWADLDATDGRRASVVALADGEPVGHVGLSHAWVDARERLVDVWLPSPLAVRPEHRRRGIGRTLLGAARAAATEAGAPMLVLEGDPRYCGPRGFEPAARHGIAPASERTPAPACQVLLLPGHRPWMRGRVVYPDVWWRHDAAGLRDPVLAEVEAALGAQPVPDQPGPAPDPTEHEETR